MGLCRNANPNIHPPKVEKRTMKKVLWICIFLLTAFLGACKDGKKADDPAKPGDKAVFLVQCLADEKYDECIKAMVSCDSASDNYKDKQKIMLKQMVRDKKKDGASLKAVECLHSDVDQHGHFATNYLQLTYSNDSTETVIFPLIWQDNQWRMR